MSKGQRYLRRLRVCPSRPRECESVTRRLVPSKPDADARSKVSDKASAKVRFFFLRLFRLSWLTCKRLLSGLLFYFILMGTAGPLLEWASSGESESAWVTVEADPRYCPDGFAKLLDDGFRYVPCERIEDFWRLQLRNPRAAKALGHNIMHDVVTPPWRHQTGGK